MAKWAGKKTGLSVEKNWSIWNGGSGPGSQFLLQDTLPPGWAGAEIPEQKNFVLLMFLLSNMDGPRRTSGPESARGAENHNFPAQNPGPTKWSTPTLHFRVQKAVVNHRGGGAKQPVVW